MGCKCNKQIIKSTTNNSRFENLSLDTPENTQIMAGYATFSIKQLEDEIDSNSEIGKKLKSVEAELDKY
jgi:putative AlgH/UPF0301 family transcriptional regulator